MGQKLLSVILSGGYLHHGGRTHGVTGRGLGMLGTTYQGGGGGGYSGDFTVYYY